MSTQEQFTAPTDPPPFVTLFQMVTGYYRFPKSFVEWANTNCI